jgi:hypothetical protein
VTARRRRAGTGRASAAGAAPEAPPRPPGAGSGRAGGSRDPWRGDSAGAEAILGRLVAGGLASLAIVGLAKNVGKTTTLGALLAAAGRLSLPVGITSIGRDGEVTDVVTGELKPRIRLADGSLVATSEMCLAAGGGRDLFDVLEDTGVRGPLGAVRIARLLREADVEVAGPTGLADLAAVVARLRRLGARVVLVDGAFDRRVSACPLVTDATVLAAGLALSPIPGEVARQARHVARQLSLPAASGWVARVARRADAAGESWATAAGGRKVVRFAGPVPGREREIAGALAAGEALALSGGVTEPLVNELLARRVAGTLVVRDPTRIFLAPQTLARWEHRGGTLAVLHPVRLLGVTVSPYEPGGRGTDPERFLALMRRELAPIPVCDVVLDGGGGVAS